MAKGESSVEAKKRRRKEDRDRKRERERIRDRDRDRERTAGKRIGKVYKLNSRTAERISAPGSPSCPFVL